MRASFLVYPLVCLLLTGCVNMTTNDHVYQIRAGNRSGAAIRFVVVDVDGANNRFGYLGRASGSKTISGVRVRFTDEMAIEWEEDGKVWRVHLTLSQYAKKKDVIESFSFYYAGNNKWRIVAREGIDEESPIVQPETEGSEAMP